MKSSYVQRVGRMAVASLVLAGACDHPVKTHIKNTISQDSVAPPSGLTVESSQIDFGRTIVGTTPSHGQTLMFFFFFLLASVLSCFLIAALVNLLRKNASPLWQRISYGACGVVLIYLAVLAAQGI